MVLFDSLSGASFSPVGCVIIPRFIVQSLAFNNLSNNIIAFGSLGTIIKTVSSDSKVAVSISKVADDDDDVTVYFYPCVLISACSSFQILDNEQI